jgi:hypothetical protein
VRVVAQRLDDRGKLLFKHLAGDGSSKLTFQVKRPSQRSESALVPCIYASSHMAQLMHCDSSHFDWISYDRGDKDFMVLIARALFAPALAQSFCFATATRRGKATGQPDFLTLDALAQVGEHWRDLGAKLIEPLFPRLKNFHRKTPKKVKRYSECVV